MLQTTFPDTSGRDPAATRLLLPTAGLLALALACAALLYVDQEELALGLVLAPVAVAVLLWRPAIGFYVLFGAALTLDPYYQAGVELLTAQVPFWSALDTVTAIPLRVSAAELLMMATLGALAARRAHDGRPILRLGRLFVPCLALSAMLVYGLWRGMSHQDLQLAYPFDLEAAIGEIRGLSYIPILYVIGHTAIESARQVRILGWIAIGALGLTALQATWITARLGSAVFTLKAIAPHEVSIYWNALILLGGALWIYRANGRERWVVGLLLPWVLLGLLANQRRTGFVALGVALLIGGVLVLADRRSRARAFRGVGLAALVVLAYGALSWNANGPLAMPAYAFRSMYAPEREEAGSNLWRQMENLNIEHTIGRSPLLGLGFGQRYFMWIEEPSLTVSGFTYWRYITHNAIYWIWIKLGLVGFVVFWHLIGSAVVLGCQATRRLENGHLKSVALTGVGLIAMEVIFSYGDVSLTSFRNMATVAAWLGVIASLDRLASAATAAGGTTGKGAAWRR